MVNDERTTDLWEKNITLEITKWFDDTVAMDAENVIEGLLTSEERQARHEILEQCGQFMGRIFSSLGQNIPMTITEIE